MKWNPPPRDANGGLRCASPTLQLLRRGNTHLPLRQRGIEGDLAPTAIASPPQADASQRQCIACPVGLLSLTRRSLAGLSAAGLAEVAAAILPLPYLDVVVANQELQLLLERHGPPHVGESRSQAGHALPPWRLTPSGALLMIRMKPCRSHKKARQKVEKLSHFAFGRQAASRLAFCVQAHGPAHGCAP